MTLASKEFALKRMIDAERIFNGLVVESIEMPDTEAVVSLTASWATILTELRAQEAAR